MSLLISLSSVVDEPPTDACSNSRHVHGIPGSFQVIKRQTYSCAVFCHCPLSSLLFDYSAPVGVRCTVINPSVCLSSSISLEQLDRSPRNFLCRSTVAVVARSSSGDVAVRYVLPVLWMTSRLPVVGRMAMRGKLNL